MIARLISALAAAVTWMALVSVSVAAEDDQTLIRTPPANAPNIVLILLDDVGFGASSTFGGPIPTPELDALAAEGLRYNRFHTTAICSPTRASLLTGRNPHVTGIGSVINVADSRPGYNGVHGKDTASVAEILRENGYSTAAFGKWHQTPDWEISQSGPFDRWPTGEGFEKFYGFLGGETDQYNPSLYEGTTPVLRPPGKDYHLTTDLVNRGIAWIRAQHAVTPAKPFFLYLAPGATHAPIQVPKRWIVPFRGKFEMGWDKIRQETLSRQKSLGVVPADAALSARPDGLPAWDTLSPDQRTIAARLMETYAGFLAQTDHEIGRLIQALKDADVFENTLVIYIVGDNGGSAEGGIGGSLNYIGALQGLPEPDTLKLERLARTGAPDTYPQYNAAWAWAMNAPFPWTKAVASHLGGTRNGMVVTWPSRIADRGGLRSQFGHVNDIVPTILDALRIDMPRIVDGVKQRPMNGTSLVYSFGDAAAPERHTTQYFEVFGHRAIYHEGWMASAFHSRLPWGPGLQQNSKSFEEDVWELYDLQSDFSQARNVAAEHPDKLLKLRALFMKEAKRNNVLPLGEPNLGNTGLPSLSAGRAGATYYSGSIGIPESAIPRIMNRSWSLEAALTAGPAASGVIAALGGQAAGISLYLDKTRHPVFVYRLFDLKTVTLAGKAPLGTGEQILRVDFAYDGGGYAKGGTLTLHVNGKAVAKDRLALSPPAAFSINETFDVGVDTGSPAGSYPEGGPVGYPFSGGQIEHVRIGAK